MADREILEMAAKAAGMTIFSAGQAERDKILGRENSSLWIDGGSTAWNPLTNDGDALRLAVSTGVTFYQDMEEERTTAEWGGDYRAIEYWHGIRDQGANAATRRAITRAAAEIGSAMP